MNRLQAFFEGHVQGVGFRYSVKQIACGYDLTGWVRNLSDGRVELQAEGEREELESFLEGIRNSHLDGFIKNTEIRWYPDLMGLHGFHIQT